jgi:hypothetical protein
VHRAGTACSSGDSVAALLQQSIFTNSPPEIALVTYESLDVDIQIAQYSAYQACAPGVEPVPSKPCEPGATAYDAVDGALTSQVR